MMRVRRTKAATVAVVFRIQLKPRYDVLFTDSREPESAGLLHQFHRAFDTLLGLSLETKSRDRRIWLARKA
jgi:hypothetical protein